MSADVLIDAEHVSKKFSRTLRAGLSYGIRDLSAEVLGRQLSRANLRPGEFWAVRDVSFQLRRGESLGLIGRNGAGKSTLLQLLNGRLRLDEGRIRVRGRVGFITELGAGFNPVQTGRENVYNNAALLGMSKRETDALFDEIIEFAELRDFIDTPVGSYSTGMRARLGYAVAAHLRPDLLMVDEVLAVGDIAFRRKCIHHMVNYLRTGGSLILVSHDMYALQAICDRSLFMDRGRVVFDGNAVEGLNQYYESLRASTADRRPHGAGGLDTEMDLQAPPVAQGVPGDGLPASDRTTNPGDAVTVTAAPVRARLEPSEARPVVIDDLSIQPVGAHELGSGLPARVILHYRALHDFDAILWGFTISTGDQLVRITSGLAGFADTKFPLVTGRGRLACTIPRLPLVAGTYVLKGGIADLDTGSPIAGWGWENPPTLFTVKATVSQVNNIRATLGDLVVLDIVWEDA